MSPIQLGGAIAPPLVVPIQIRCGWRAAFHLFGMLGVVWAIAWYGWFRDFPAEKPGISRAELSETAHVTSAPAHSFPWRLALGSETVLAMLATAFCYVYVYNFFQTWFHTLR